MGDRRRRRRIRILWDAKVKDWSEKAIPGRLTRAVRRFAKFWPRVGSPGLFETFGFNWLRDAASYC